MLSVDTSVRSPPHPAPQPDDSPLDDPATSARQLSHASTHGCMDPVAMNFDSRATSYCCCFYGVPGCIDSRALNYASYANVDDDTCVPRLYGCMDGTATNHDSAANSDEPSWCTYIFVQGCTAPQALNYNSLATRNDGSCVRARPPDRPTMP